MRPASTVNPPGLMAQNINRDVWVGVQTKREQTLYHRCMYLQVSPFVVTASTSHRRNSGTNRSPPLESGIESSQEGAETAVSVVFFRLCNRGKSRKLNNRQQRGCRARDRSVEI